MLIIQYRGKGYAVDNWRDLADVAWNTEKIDLIDPDAVRTADLAKGVESLQQILNKIEQDE